MFFFFTAQAGWLLAPFRHDLHHAVGRAADALSARDRAQARLGRAGRASTQLLQDDRQVSFILFCISRIAQARLGRARRASTQLLQDDRQVI